MKLSRIKFLLFDKMLLIYSSTRAAHTTHDSLHIHASTSFHVKDFQSISHSERDAGFMNIINVVTVLQSVSVHAHCTLWPVLMK